MEKTKGLVLKQSDWGDGNRMLTIFTEDFGIIKAAVYGVKKAKSRQAASTQFLCWSEFVLYFGRGEVASVNSATAIESFFPICEDIQKLALCTYLAEITAYTQDKNIPNKELLSLLLNTIYSCAYRFLDIKKAKLIYEMRLVRDIGYMPNVRACSACGDECEPEFFSCECGGVVCKSCHNSRRDDLPMTKDAYHALIFVLFADGKKVFSFDLSEAGLRSAAEISEKYLISKIEKEFSSLDYLKKVLT